MIQTYDEAMEYVQSKRESGIRFDLTRMERLMEELYHPERRVKTIHVAGTNGKGSTITFLRSILEESGLFVGTFMTPVYGNLESQIAINNEAMSKDDFVLTLSEIVGAIKEVEEELKETISEFELMTTIALYYFSKIKPADIAIIETGMGGRNDATNVITPLVSIITNIAKDHEAFLGETMEEIAREKAGIIKSGVAVVTGAKDEGFGVIREEAKRKRAKLYAANDQFHFSTFLKEETQVLHYSAPYCKIENATLKMIGNHQGENAALALTAITYLKQFYALLVEDEHIIEGLRKASLSGRLEIVEKTPPIVLDTAHNVAAIERSVMTMKERFPHNNIHVLFASMVDKDIANMLNVLKKQVDHLTITTFNYERGADQAYYEAIVKEEPYQYTSDPVGWVNNWRNEDKEGDALLLIGSNYFIEEIKDTLF